MSLSQIKVLAAAISRQETTSSLNTMNWMRIAYHADKKDYERIAKDLQRK